MRRPHQRSATLAEPSRVGVQGQNLFAHSFAHLFGEKHALVCYRHRFTLIGGLGYWPILDAVSLPGLSAQIPKLGRSSFGQFVPSLRLSSLFRAASEHPARSIADSPHTSAFSLLRWVFISPSSPCAWRADSDNSPCPRSRSFHAC